MKFNLKKNKNNEGKHIINKIKPQLNPQCHTMYISILFLTLPRSPASSVLGGMQAPQLKMSYGFLEIVCYMI